jgi:hypothetical protein
LLVWFYKRRELGGNSYLTALAMGCAYSVMGLNYGRFSTIAHLFLWLLLIKTAFQSIQAANRLPEVSVAAAPALAEQRQ